jgi:hypothetical protein
MLRPLHELLRQGLLLPAKVILGPRDQVNRRLFWTAEFDEWCTQICREPQTRTLASIPEQLNVAFADFVSGRPLTSGLARCDPPRGEGIWRLKTPDLRLYGWADEAHCMVLAHGERKSVINAPGPPKDKDMGRLVVRCRKDLRLRYAIGERYDIFPAIS